MHIQHVGEFRTILVSWCVQGPKWLAVRGPGPLAIIGRFKSYENGAGTMYHTLNIDMVITGLIDISESDPTVGP